MLDITLKLPDCLACGDHIGMLVSVFQPKRIEIAAHLFEACLIRAESTAAGDDHLRRTIDAQHLRHRGDLLTQGVPSGRGIIEIALGPCHRGARLIEPIVAVTRGVKRIRGPVGNDVRILPSHFRSPCLGGA